MDVLNRGFLALLVVLVCCLSITAQDGSDPYNGRAYYTVSTYECIGIYYKADDQGECGLRYRPRGDSAWKDFLGLVFDARDQEYRGSLVGLQPDTEYEIEIQCGGSSIPFSAKTRSDHFPIGKTTVLGPGLVGETVRIDQSGTADAYHLVTVPEKKKTTIDVKNSQDACLIIEANYVIVRGLECANAARHAIVIADGCHDVVIEDCRVTFWGRIGGPVSYGNAGSIDSAIYADKGAGNLTIQRNLLENPRGASNDWETGHPNGPQGISLRNSSGGNVIRYNEIRSTEDHGFNDGIGGSSNYSFEGSPNRDSDIYGNIITHVWDDGIESEGANMNVRIWGNYIHKTYQHIATACTSKGPLYIFRNVFGESRVSHKNPLGGSMIKTGQRDEFGGGRKFIFHNTGLQPKGAFHVFSGHPDPNTVTRNNVFDAPGRLATSRKEGPIGDYDYDFFKGMDRGIAQEPHRISGNPAFLHSYKLEFYPASSTTKVQYGKIEVKLGDETRTLTDPAVTVPNPLLDRGIPIPGFNDDYAGSAPDLGAFELGRPPVRFGRDAVERVWAPWEIY